MALLLGASASEADGLATTPPISAWAQAAGIPKCVAGDLEPSTVAPDGPWQSGDPICDASGLGKLIPDRSRQAPPTPSPPGGPAAHAETHYIGPYTNYNAVRGIYTGRYVSDPPVGSGDTLYATMHIGIFNPYRFGEIGWYKFSNGTRGIFIYATDYGFVDYGQVFPISTGQLLHMFIQYTPVGATEYWTPFLWWDNSWIALASFQIGGSSPSQTDLFYEAITDASHFFLPQTQVDGTNLYTCTPSCAWVVWNASIPQSSLAPDGLPYHAHLQSGFSKWYGHRH